MEQDEHFFMCECQSEAIHVAKFSDDNIYFSIWSRNSSSKPPIWLRLKHIWKILVTGTPYDDEVILNKEKSLQLSTWIQNQLTP